MIPKIIHYCWFGGQEYPDKVKRYIDSWHRYCPNYKIIEWNETNFNVNENVYCREAYEAKMWAFVSDYVRLKVLYEYGGIYMDTDVEICKNIDPLLKFSAVFGYETNTSIQTGAMASSPRNEWIGVLLNDYEKRHFVISDNNYDLTTNVSTITRLTKEKFNIRLNGKFCKFGDNMVILPFEYLCAKEYQSGEVVATNKTYMIHHFNGSWLKEDDILQRDEKRKLLKKFSWIPFFYIRYWVSSFLAIWKVGGLNRLIHKIWMRL